MFLSHEVPLCLLEDSLQFNDFDYALVHLLEQDQDYVNFFIKSKKLGREIHLDNSLHELGYSMNNEILLKWIDILKPTNFYIPDVWCDASASIRNAREWSKIELPKEVTKVAVVQGENLTHAVICYQTYRDLGYNKIAFSYGAPYYNDISSHSNKDLGKALGRIQVISKMYEMGIIKDTHKIHLLGTAAPQEFGWYKDFPFIDSLDTSNPIMATLDGLRYTNNGLNIKPKSNMNDSFYIISDKIDYELLDHNITSFKKIIE